MTRSLALALVFLCCVSTLRAQTPTEGAAPTTLMPLEVGNSWTYKLIEISASHIDPSEQEKLRDQMPVTLTVAREVKLAGKTFFEVSVKGEEVLIANGDSGVYMWNEHDASAWLLFPYPAAAGESRTILSGDDDGDAMTAEVIAIDENIVLGEEMLSCYHYRIRRANGEGAPADVYIAPGLGLVRMSSQKMRGTDMEVRIDLVGHSVRSVEVEAKSDVD